ncbi:unnamed protein product, partial [marine sediment metagenome]
MKALNIPIFEKKGFEADDIIATLSRQAHSFKNIETIIVTGDLDVLQLIDDQTKVYTMRRGLTDTVIYDEKKVNKRYGFGPEHI